MNKKTIRRIFIGLAIIFAAAAVWFGVSLYKTMREYKRGNEDLSQMYEAMGGLPAPIPKEEQEKMDPPALRAVKEEQKQQRQEAYDRLETRNTDMIGWIRIEDTVIDYPVMQTPDNPDFYLRRGFDKKYSAYGMIYMDASCSLEEECPNYVLYGHHMKNGSMFASIEKYASQEYYEEHPVLGFDTLDAVGDYEVVAAFKLPAAQMDNKFAYKLAARTEEDYLAFVDYIKANGFYDTGITPQWPEQLITLTTCEYTQSDGRFFVVARKVQD